MSHDNPRLVPNWPGQTADDALTDLVARLTGADGPADEAGTWPDRLWSILGDAGATRWALPVGPGGTAVERPSLLRRYGRVAEGSLTAAFILTQHDSAVRRLAARGAGARANAWLARIDSGTAFATVGISQLTTSNRRGPAALVATPLGDGYRLDGALPWVTAAERADVIVAGAVLEDGRQLLVALPTDGPGVTIHPEFRLAALQASLTTEVLCEGVVIEPVDVLAGPVADVMTQPGVAGTGGLETSALALGQARAALAALADLTPQRGNLDEPIEALADAWRDLATDLLGAATGQPEAPTPGEIRGRANALVLRCTQAYLTARKGSGFLLNEPAQRWARQALFFLVWSCPSPVAQAALREFAGLCPT